MLGRCPLRTEPLGREAHTAHWRCDAFTLHEFSSTETKAVMGVESGLGRDELTDVIFTQPMSSHQQAARRLPSGSGTRPAAESPRETLVTPIEISSRCHRAMLCWPRVATPPSCTPCSAYRGRRTLVLSQPLPTARADCRSGGGTSRPGTSRPLWQRAAWALRRSRGK